MKLQSTCDKCGLCKTRKNIVWGEGEGITPLMAVFEAAGEMEDDNGSPLWHEARTGKEYNQLLFANRIDREMIYTTNLVKCRPPNNRDPKPEEIKACCGFLLEEIHKKKPRVILSAGRFSTRFLLGDVDMEAVHGVPHEIEIDGHTCIVVPSFHVAAGLRNPESMMKVHYDFKVAFDVLRGQLTKYRVTDHFKGNEIYGVCNNPDEMDDFLRSFDTFFIDTETVRDAPWSIQITPVPGVAKMVYADNERVLAVINDHLNRPNARTVVHNALFDLIVMAEMGIEPRYVVDTMVMAYLLQSEPQGLKALAYRHAGMYMQNYTEVVRPSADKKALAYLKKVQEYQWPDPDPVLTFVKKKGKEVPHVKKPTNISRKVKAIFGDIKKDKRDKDGNPVDPRARWRKIDLELGRAIVEQCLGEMEDGYLSEIPEEQAVYYACRDADATARVYPYLMDRIRAFGLERTLDIDMGIIPMVHDMMDAGILPDLPKFKELSERFGRKILNLSSQINIRAGRHVKVGSHLDIKKLIYDDLKLGTRAQQKRRSSEDKVLAALVGDDPIVQMVRDWRQYSKLKGTYADKMPKMVGKDGRIHATFRITRTSTGRLCVDPDTTHVEMPRDMEKYPKGKLVRNIKAGDLVYSFDHNRELCIREVKWCGPTKKCKTVVLKYKAKEGAPIQELILSPDHLVRLFSRQNKGDWIHAAHLEPGDRLLCMPPRHNHGQGYYTFFPHSKNRGDGQKGGGRVKEHRFIYSQLHEKRLSSKNIIHHSDHNPKNNEIGNLRLVRGVTEHLKLHGVNHVIVSVEPGPVKQLWDLEVEDTHAFIGNEVCLHNSASKPNLMAQPTRNKDGKEIRNCYIAQPGCVFTSADYSGVEMRMAAHLSGDPELTRIFEQGLDIHSETASRIFGIPVSQVTEMKHRYPSKRVGFGILYDVSASGLREQLVLAGLDPNEWTVKKCYELIQGWFDVYKGVARFMRDTATHARRYGYVRDMWGRIRFVPQVKAADDYLKAKGLRQAGNQPIQSGAQGIIKRAMADLTPVYKRFRQQGFIINPLIQIHDDLVFEVQRDILPVWLPLKVGIMESAAKLNVPVPVDAKIGERWGSMIKAEKWFKENAYL